jgi:hypothetical protein
MGIHNTGLGSKKELSLFSPTEKRAIYLAKISQITEGKLSKMSLYLFNFYIPLGLVVVLHSNSSTPLVYCPNRLPYAGGCWI